MSFCFRGESGHPLPRRLTAPNPLRGLVFCHCNHGAGERAVGLSQLIQNREVIGVGDRYQVAWDMPLRPISMVIAAARDHGRQLAGAVGDTQRLVDDRPPDRREVLDFLATTSMLNSSGTSWPRACSALR